VTEKYNYDVALSFASEDAAYVKAVARYLEERSVRVYFADFNEVENWGKDLTLRFDEVYRMQSEYCVVFISRHYKEKIWPNHELKSALARALQQKGKEYILPARFDGTEIPGILPTVHYIDLRKYPNPEDFAEIVIQKTGKGRPSEASASTGPGFRKPRMARKDFNPYEEAQQLIRYIADELKKRCHALADQGVECSLFEREGRTCLRVLHEGTTRYALDMWMGGASGLGGDSSVSFASTRGEPRYMSGVNASGEMVWSKTEDRVVIRIFNLSFIGQMGEKLELTHEQLLEEVWTEIIKALEKDE